MLDFNDAPAELPSNPGVTRESLRTDLVARLDSILPTLFPAGNKRKGKFLIGDVLGSPGDSLEVVLDGEKAGLWTDRATGDGGDIFDLIAAYLSVDAHTDFPRVMQHAADLLGQAPVATSRKSKKKEVPVDDLGPATAKWDYLRCSGPTDCHRLPATTRLVEEGIPAMGRQATQDGASRPQAAVQPAGMKDAAQVVLVEGEKCAQALINAGVTATTAMHGANARSSKTDWTPLTGKAVLIWPDRDKPGWEYAAQCCASGVGRRCQVLPHPVSAPGSC
jgi:putative DNA primase/helicase